jgi:hypothetical protein
MLLTDMVTPVEAQAFPISVTARLKEITPASEPPYCSLQLMAQLAELPEVLQEGLPVALLVHLCGNGVKLRLGEVARRVLYHFLGVCQFHIHKTLASPLQNLSLVFIARSEAAKQSGRGLPRLARLSSQ